MHYSPHVFIAFSQYSVDSKVLFQKCQQITVNKGLLVWDRLVFEGLVALFLAINSYNSFILHMYILECSNMTFFLQ